MVLALGAIVSSAATVKSPGKPKSTMWQYWEAGGEAGKDGLLGRGVPGVKEAGVILLAADIGSEEYAHEEMSKKDKKCQGYSCASPPH